MQSTHFSFFRWVQNQFVQAEFWHDPLNEEKYKKNSIFIAEINNERFINETYRDNLKKLRKLVLVKFEKDTMVEPADSEWFEFYTPGQGIEITKLQNSTLYLEVRLMFFWIKLVDSSLNLLLDSCMGENIFYAHFMSSDFDVYF